ncbi:hypothetical protein J7T55_015793 [Diaporthe amygdali]|uniref:uncharacterized protein n=1 Tax=Phomopsis amygdali TaxID=1214568 RepID=UPI0022FF2F68|nr:uncharacterized protein J7T55_015793 [Diaporthe amygdali]KAJ0107327.1 hypothetical protein J7T55_015793 [Diaporthe amygdali]
MPPKQPTSGASRGRPAGSKNKAAASSAISKKPSAAAKGKQRAQPSESPEPRRRDDSEEAMDVDEDLEDDGDDEEPEKTIPPELLTRILHEFFEKDGTRITKDANNAVAKYMDIFVKEAIARAAAERDGGFLEVEDLEKIAPQLLSTSLRDDWNKQRLFSSSKMSLELSKSLTSEPAGNEAAHDYQELDRKVLNQHQESSDWVLSAWFDTNNLSLMMCGQIDAQVRLDFAHLRLSVVFIKKNNVPSVASAILVTKVFG